MKLLETLYAMNYELQDPGSYKNARGERIYQVFFRKEGRPSFWLETKYEAAYYNTIRLYVAHPEYVPGEYAPKVVKVRME